MYIDSSNIIMWGIVAILILFTYQVIERVIGRLLAITYTRRMYRKSVEKAMAKLKKNVSVDNFEVVHGVAKQFRSNAELMRIKDGLEYLISERELLQEIDEHDRMVKVLFSVIHKGKKPNCLLAKNYLNKTIESSLLLPELLSELEFLCHATKSVRKKDVELLLEYLKRINTILKQIEIK